MALNKPEPAQEEEDTISITRLLQAVWKRILWVIAAVVIAVAASAIITQFFITPQYQASCWLFVNNFSNSTSQNEVSSAQLQAATQLANTYIQMLRSETVLNDVSGELGGVYSAQQLSQMISASVITDTQILVITVTHPDPEQAAQIANAVAQVAPASIQSFVEGSSVTVPQYASVPTAPSSPSMSRKSSEPQPFDRLFGGLGGRRRRSAGGLFPGHPSDPTGQPFGNVWLSFAGDYPQYGFRYGSGLLRAGSKVR